ncbi:hypothetical protein GCM10022378_19260 [Salinicoccus jeotgali]|uniref:Phage tail protein n=1 Tax=Salinicoccus jeotgali TaxID=381634 RepID=A0ABP7F9K0_9STAP
MAVTPPSRFIGGKAPVLTVDFDASVLGTPVINDYSEVTLKHVQAETAAPIDKKVLREGSRTRDVIKKLTEDTWVLEEYSDEGLRTLTNLNITYGTENRNVYTIKEGDPLSAKVECDWKVIVKDDDIDTELTTRSVMTADQDYYYLLNELTAWNDRNEVFSKAWNKKIKRNYT